ncbi:hypothetical protein Clacol_001916 [Clathrus columnatus]|uniref:Annexin n=1 Tax=Clathrus columnatus TaxID=1419009 RepID=A0AAV4ZZD1_9AGAM|nr:hypothetical protein Clacol_001916 [Clathrus columnatus]
MSYPNYPPTTNPSWPAAPGQTQQNPAYQPSPPSGAPPMSSLPEGRYPSSQGYPSPGLTYPSQGYPPGRTSPSPSVPYPIQGDTQPFGAPGGFAPPRPPASPRPEGLIYLGVPIPPPPPNPPYRGSPPGFDANRVAGAIRKAVKGFGTDEKALTEAIAPLDAFQMESVRRAYESSTGKDLVKTIEKETSSWYEYSLRGKALGPVAFDCWLLHRASSGFGTHEDLLTGEIITLKAAYSAIYRHDLTSVIRSELSAKTERLFIMILSANRDEREHVEFGKVQADVQTLYAAGPGRTGTDEITICSIIATRSQAHIRAIVRAYHQTYGVKLSTAIRNEFSGHMKSALEFVIQGAEEDGYGVYRDAVLIHDAMEGVGTKDERLIYRIIRSHWNKPRFAAIKQYYQELYGKSLVAKVRSETSGDYRDFMCAVISSA